MLLSAMLLISSTKWCHEWLAAFHIYRHKHFQCITSDVECSFSSQVGLPWFIPPRWRPWGPLARGPTPQVYFWFFVMRVSTRVVLSSGSSGSWYFGVSYLRQELTAPGDSLRTFREICDRLRAGLVCSIAQGFLPVQARHDCILNFKPRSRPLGFRCSFVSPTWPVLSAPSTRCS